MATHDAAMAGPGPGEESLGVTNGKLGMWTFLVMDAMTFAGFLAAYARLRWAPGSNWPLPIEEFGPVGIQLTALNTFILICSSVSMVHVLAEQLRGNMVAARKWMAVTVIGGLIFLGIQGFEWTHLILDLWPFVYTDATYGFNQNFAATFFSLTGFHGLHVSVGVIYNFILYLGIRNGKIGPEDTSITEIAGLYWHFVDLIWILVFTFVYLI
ncbi:MAG: heme-copper oxidase subunit III [Bradymonadaceae bacterium]|nr:heme-copper oxidase subunit III [Lujinxingiaceae bacterium]